jgi:hypothetical protein
MTRLVLLIALALFSLAGCKKDSSSHSHGDGEEHSHDGDEDHAHDDKKPADPPTKEVPVPEAADEGAAAKQPAPDAAVKQADDKGHDHGEGEHTH